MYNPQLSRREFLRGTARGTGALATADLYSKVAATAGGFGGLVGVLGTPQLSTATSKEILGLEEFREYAKRVFEPTRRFLEEKRLRHESVGFNPPAIFYDSIDDRIVEVTVNQGLTGVYELKMKIFDGYNSTKISGKPYYEFEDIGIKGDLLGPKDHIRVGVVDSKEWKSWESASAYGDGGYFLEHRRKLKEGEVCKPQFEPELTKIGICLDGTAYYNPREKKSQSRGVYKDMTQSELQKKHEEVFRNANEKYQRLLQIGINRLVKKGKLKISIPTKKE